MQINKQKTAKGKSLTTQPLSIIQLRNKKQRINANIAFKLKKRSSCIGGKRIDASLSNKQMKQKKLFQNLRTKLQPPRRWMPR